MMRRKQKGERQRLAGLLFLFITCQCFPTALFAGDETAGTFGASYLRVPVGAALMAVPDVVASMDPDGSLAFSNPAGISRVSQSCVFFSRANWLDELSLNAAGAVVPIPRHGLAFSFGSRLLYAGELNGFDGDDQVVSEDSYYGLALSTALSKRFDGLGLSLGVGVTYMREHLPAETGDGLAVSFGMSYERSSHHIDVFAEDVGGTMSFEGHKYAVAGRYALGYGYAFNRGWGRLDVGTQIVFSHSALSDVQLGAACHLNRFFIFRGGFDRAIDGAQDDQLPIGAGLGFRYGSLMLDYAFTPQEYFTSTHTFSVGFSFGGGSMGGATLSAAVPPVPSSTNLAAERAASKEPAPVKKPKEQAAKYEIIAGVHSRAESARAEIRALRLVKVAASLETVGDRYKVLVGRYPTLEAANSALERFEKLGHRFQLEAL